MRRISGKISSMWAARVLGVGLALVGVLGGGDGHAKAKGKRKVARRHGDPAVVSPPDAERTPAVRYGALDRDGCLAELARRKIPFAQEEELRGVLAPVRLTGEVGGVAFHSALSPAKRLASSQEVVDCRLALALDDFAAILRRHDVVEVVHLSAYRAPPRRWPDGKEGQRHHGGLALDAATFVRSDGSTLRVERDFYGAIGAKTCGPKAAPRRSTPESLALRAIACDTADARLFNVQLSPNYDRKHKNHFHLEVTPGASWFLVR